MSQSTRPTSAPPGGADARAGRAGARASSGPTSDLAVTVNGAEVVVEVDNRTTLLDLLRERLDLVGAKKGCDHGQCGACTVLLDGRRANSCLVLAVTTEGSDVRTVEGLPHLTGATGEDLHPVQQAFLDRDAYQCGYCTPGQICSAVGALAEARDGWPSAVSPGEAFDGADLDAEEVAERMSGNICRCAAYANIVPAVLDAHAATGGGQSSSPARDEAAAEER